MGRKHSINHNLPSGMRARKRKRKNKVVIYYTYEIKGENGKRPEISLSNDYHEALRKYVELEQIKLNKQKLIKFNDVSMRYTAEIIPQAKAENTRRNKLQEIKCLNDFFDGAPLDEIMPKHIRQYLDWRRDTPSAANNEITLFSNIWNKAREWGYTDKTNPADGVARYPKKQRENYVENNVYQLVYDHSPQEIKDLMDIAYLIGQRPIDIVGIHSRDVQDGILQISQAKTKAKLRFEISGSLKVIFDRILPTTPDYLFKNKQGKRLKRERLTVWFRELRNELMAQYPEFADEINAFQFRDLRAKSATDLYLSETLTHAKEQLGHTNEQTTQIYIRKPKTKQPIQSAPRNFAEQNENCGTALIEKSDIFKVE